MLRIAVCDDEALHCAYAAQMIRTHPECPDAEIRQFLSPQELLNALENETFLADIAVVDICMEEMDGIALAKEVNAHAPGCQIIFLSSYLEYAPDVYDAEHVYFLLKEQMKTRLMPALQKAIENLRSSMPRMIVLKERSTSYQIPVSEILYFERVLRKTRIVSTGGEYWSKLTPAALLSDVDGSSFCRCHQSFYVNMQHVVSMNPDSFTLSNGQPIFISRTYKKAAKEQFLFRSHSC